MHGGTNRLTDKAIRGFLKGAQPGRKLADGEGLYLTVTRAGTATWRIKYRHAGEERTYSVGPHPGIGLQAARAERQQVKDWLRQGRDPVQQRKLNRAKQTAAAGATFAQVTTDWLEKKRKGWSAVHYAKASRALERDVLPALGPLPIAEIEPAMVATVIEAVARRGARDTAGRILQHVSGVFRLAQARGLRTDNPAAPVHEVLPKKTLPKGRPALLTWPELGHVLRAAEKARLSPAVRLALRLAAFTGARIGNVVAAEWKEFDLEAEPALWVIPRSKMKMRDRTHDHKIILSSQIAEELRAWRKLMGARGYVFASASIGKHITRESLEKVYRVTLDLGDKHTPHGWRAALSTLARDEGFERDVVELALDHVHDNDVVRAYDRGERLEKRIQLASWWGNQLAKAEHGADVVALKPKHA